MRDIRYSLRGRTSNKRFAYGQNSLHQLSFPNPAAARREQHITRLNIQAQTIGGAPLEPGLVTSKSHWRYQTERVEERIENASAILQIAPAIPIAIHNNHEVDRFGKEIRNSLESLFDPITAAIGPDEGLKHNLKLNLYVFTIL